MKTVLPIIVALWLISCQNQSASHKSANDTTKDTAVERTSSLNSGVADTAWYTAHQADYEKVSYEFLEDSFLKLRLERYFILDDEAVFTDYTCKDKNCRIKHLREYKSIFKTKPFDTASHHLTYTEGNILYLIDNTIFWGADGTLPISEIDSFEVFYKGEKTNLEPAAYKNLYNCQNTAPEKIHFKDGSNDYVIFLMNASDGAGSYTVAWVFKNGQYIRRIVDAMC